LQRRPGDRTDQFDTLSPLVDWVEKGIAPDSIVATAANPGYFNAAAQPVRGSKAATRAAATSKTGKITCQ
jgi:Tannase and feruloyl esterase